MILLFAGQLGLARWQTDEYVLFAEQRARGWRELADRLLVSPRPISELGIHLYGMLVLALDRPLVVTVLAALWLGLLASLVLAAAAAGSPPGRWRLGHDAFKSAPALTPARPPKHHTVVGGRAGVRAGADSMRTHRALAAALAASLVAFALVTSPVTELFYWPVAAIAYLPAIAGVTAAMFLLAGEPDARRQRWCAIALLVAALSHEIGAAVAIGLACSAAAARRPAGARDWWWIAPALVGLAVMLMLVLFRSGINDLGADAKPYTGHMLASLVATLRQLAIDVVTTGDGDTLGLALLAKLLFCIGFALTWARFGGARAGPWHAALFAGLVTGAFFSLLAAFYHYGDLCCERQAATRHWLIDLALVIAALAALGRHIPARWPGWLGPILLTLSLFPLALRADAIRQDYIYYPLALAARGRTWASGTAGGSDTMKFYLPPDRLDMLVHGTSQTLGSFDTQEKAPEMIAGAARFFEKRYVIVCQAWQTDKSWLIDGQFIPACPPHPGPPDIVYDTR